MKNFKKTLIALCSCVFGLCCLAACGEDTSDPAGDNSSIVEETSFTVTFDPCAEDYEGLKTSKPLQQKDLEEGDYVKEPSIRATANPNGYELDGWYTSKDYTTKWDFRTDTVSSSMTLYARWVIGYEINYYLTDGTQAELKRTGKVAEGGYAERADNVALGYELLGYYADASCETEFDFTQVITEDTDIYVKRSGYIYFDAETIANRFRGVAGGAGEQGGSFGAIEYVEDSDGGYVDVDFGYSPAGMDPHLMLENMHLDITQTQKIQVTFKNPYEYVAGANRGAHIVLYWSSQYEDGTYAFSQGAFSGMEIAYTMSADEYYTDGEWITATFDLSSKMYNGTYVWANSSYLGLLRLQYQYSAPSASAEESYHLWIKEIKGVTDLEDREAKQAQDSFGADFLESDSQEELDGVQRANIDGFSFPADSESIRSAVMCDPTGIVQSIETYNKTEGVLVYMPFRTAYNEINLKPADGQEFVLEEYKSIKLTIRNYGYIPYLELSFTNTEGGEFFLMVNLPSNMQTVDTITIPLNTVYGFEGTLKTLRISANSNGVDNAYLLQSIEFCKFDADLVSPVAGFNFHTEADANAYAVGEGMSFVPELYATKATVATDGAYVEKALTKFAIHAYGGMTLRYSLPANSAITAVNVELTVDGTPVEHTIYVSAEDGVPVSVALKATGEVTKVKISFVGTGVIYLHSLGFDLRDAAGIDLSNKSVAEGYIAHTDWTNASYDEGMAAMKLNVTKANQMFYLADSGANNLAVGENAKLYIVYQNTASTATAVISVYGASGEKEGINYSNGSDHWLEIQPNMTDGEWAVMELDLSAYQYDYISCVKFNNVAGYTSDITVRAIVVK